MKKRATGAILLSGIGILLSLSATNSVGSRAAPVDAAGYLPTPRPTEGCDVCEPNESRATACGPLAPNTDYRYALRCAATIDDDVYYIDTGQSGKIVADLTSIPAATNYNLYLYDKDSNLLAYSVQPGNGPEHLEYDAPQAGRYYARVYPQSGCSDSNLYTLRLAYPTPPPTPIPTPTQTPPTVCNVHIDDFADQNSDNDLGRPSSWGTTPQGCSSFSPVYSGSDVQLAYNLNVPGACTARYTTTLALDATAYDLLTFEVNADTAAEFVYTFVGLTDQAGNSAKVKVGDFAARFYINTWQSVAVPLEVFATRVDISRLSAFFVEFDKTVGPDQGVVSLDSLRLERSRAPIVVDNFDDRSYPNALGGSLSTFTGSVTSTIQATYTTSATFDNSTASYAVVYTVPVGYAVWQTHLSGLDVSDYAHLSFYLKGAAGGEKVNLYLADGDGVRRFVDVETFTPVRTSWGLVKVPLTAFRRQGVNLADLSWIQFAFEYEPMTGTIFLDNLRFEADPLWVDNFCDAESLNNTNKATNNSLNGAAGIFKSDTCSATLTSTLVSSTSLKLDYDVRAGPGCFAGYSSATPLDLTSYRTLGVKVRGERCGEVAAVSVETDQIAPLKIGLHDYLVDGVTDQWQEAKIPLAGMPEIADWTRSRDYAIAFEANRGATKGAVFWDDVRFMTECSTLWVDNFNDEDAFNALYGVSYVISDTPAMTMTTSIVQAYGDAGAGLALNYNVPVGRYAGWTTDLRGVDLSGYDSLIFRVKGTAVSVPPHVYLEEPDHTRVFVALEKYVQLSTDWRTVNIPLDDFTGLDLSRIQSLQFVIEYQTGAVQGSLYFDDVHFGCRNIVFLPTVMTAVAASAFGAVAGPAWPIETSSVAADAASNSIWDFESSAQGWTYQTYTNTRAIVAVGRSTFRAYSGAASLAAVLDLKGGDANRSQGEAFVDVSNTPPSPGQTSLNLACRPVSCWVYVPTCAVGDGGAPNQVQLFAKNANGKSEYGTPVTVARNQWFKVDLRPSTVKPEGGFIDAGFTPTAIDQLGIRFKAPGGSTTQYRGKVYIDACGWQEIIPPASQSQLACVP